jgi:hypothetical protein
MDDATATLAARLDDMEDVAAIKALKIRYARYCDDGYDADGIASLFVDDGIWDGGALFGRGEGVAGIRQHFSGASSRIPWALHFTLSPEIELQGPPGPQRRARATWYLWQPCVRSRADGSEQEAFLTGTYTDTYVKVAGQWKFETVLVQARWFSGPPSSA